MTVYPASTNCCSYRCQRGQGNACFRLQEFIHDPIADSREQRARSLLEGTSEGLLFLALLGKSWPRPYDKNHRTRTRRHRGENMNQDYIIVQCPNCGAKNRIPAEKRGKSARCGRCHTPLTAGPYAGASAHRTCHRCDLSAGGAQESGHRAGGLLGALVRGMQDGHTGSGPAGSRILPAGMKVAKLNVDENPSPRHATASALSRACCSSRTGPW